MDESTVRLVDSFLEVLSKGQIREDTIDQLTYYPMMALKTVMEQLEDGVDTFRQVKNYLDDLRLKRIREKSGKIKIGILADEIVTWDEDELYELLEKSGEFTPVIYVTELISHSDRGERRRIYQETCAYFEGKGFRCVKGMNEQEDREYTWEELGGAPDIMIYLNPYKKSSETFWLATLPLSVLILYIPYAFFLASNPDDSYMQSAFNQFIHNLAFRIYYAAPLEKKMAERFCYIGSDNVIISGSPKMDSFFLRSPKESSPIWTMLANKAGLVSPKKVLYCPHHTIATDDLITQSTFFFNWQYIFSLAQKTRDTCVWICRPHPHFRDKIFKYKIWNEEEWNAFVSLWNDLPNACYSIDGDYMDILEQSDAMINDSGSFLAEYSLTGHPMLNLERPMRAYTELGLALREGQYNLNAFDFDGIDQFVKTIILEGEDEKKETRAEITNKALGIDESNPSTACRAIFIDICSQLR